MDQFNDHLIVFLNEYGATVMGFVLAFLMALWRTAKVGLKATMSGFMQSTSSDVIITGVGMFEPFANPLLSVVDNGDGTYVLQLSDFTNVSTPNWGSATSVRVEYTLSGTLIASGAGAYSTVNMMVVD